MKEIVIQGNRFKLIEKSGHLPNMEQGEIFNAAIQEFYQSRCSI